MPTFRDEAPSDGGFEAVENWHQDFLSLLHGLSLIVRTSGVCLAVTDTLSPAPYRP